MQNNTTQINVLDIIEKQIITDGGKYGDVYLIMPNKPSLLDTACFVYSPDFLKEELEMYSLDSCIKKLGHYTDSMQFIQDENLSQEIQFQIDEFQKTYNLCK